MAMDSQVYKNKALMVEGDNDSTNTESKLEQQQVARFISALKMLDNLKKEKERLANDQEFQNKKITEAMWFFSSKKSAISSIFCMVACLVVNCVLFFHNYNLTIRIYQFIVCVLLLVSCMVICYYWSQPEGPQIEDDTFSHISWPMIAMTSLMAAASVIGYLDFIYFTTIFMACDEAIDTSVPWEIVSDMCFNIAFVFSFSLYSFFIFQCYFKPIFSKWRWILHLVATNVVIVFIHLTLKELHHSYDQMCSNFHAEPCVTIVEHHHFHCNESQLKEIQKLWLEMHSQMIQPGIFLVVAEYLPLLLVMLLMAPVAKNSSSIHQLMRAILCASTAQAAPKHIQYHDDDFHRPTVWQARVTFYGSVFLFILTFFRFGVLLNCLGRYPNMDYAYEGVAQALTFSTMSALFIYCMWIWLKNIKEPTAEKDDEEMMHHLVHARLDSLLLRTAFIICILQILVASLVDMPLYKRKYISVVVKIPVIIAYLMQYLLLTKAMKLVEFHWKSVNKVAACMLTVAALTTNLIEWNAHFLKRRFNVFFLASGHTITQADIAGAAVAEMLYPALSFYHFHAALCWLTVLWRVLKCFMKELHKES